MAETVSKAPQFGNEATRSSHREPATRTFSKRKATARVVVEELIGRVRDGSRDLPLVRRPCYGDKEKKEFEERNLKISFDELKTEWDKANLEQRGQFKAYLRDLQQHIAAKPEVEGAKADLTWDERSTLPATAPALWKARTRDRATNPAKFIEDMYGDWIGRGLTRALIGDLDPELYQAYATWVRRHPQDALNLPTRSDVIDQRVRKLGGVARYRDALPLSATDKERLQLKSTLRTRKARAKKEALQALPN